MPLTSAQAFDEFLADISATDSQRLDITSKRRATEAYLREAFPESSDLPIARVILIGSADRGTIIRPVDDIDVMAQFTNKDNIFEKYRHDSTSCLQRIRRALNAQTSIKKIGARGQAVRLFYTSGAAVDIAPVFKWSGQGYGLASGDGGWITTDPEAQAAWYSGRRGSVGSELTNHVKMTKRWNNVHSKRLKSYHLEVVVASLFSSVSTNHRIGLTKFFAYAGTNLSVSDPAGHSGRLDDYLSALELSSLRSRLAEAYARSTRALAAEERGDHYEAKRLWSMELGPDFPVH